MSNSWLSEFSRFFWLGLFVGVFGLLFGEPVLVLLIYTLSYLGWYFYNLRRMDHWIRKGKKYIPPEAQGLWGDLFNEIYYLRQRSRKRSKRLVKLLNRFRETTGAMPDGIILLKEQGDIEWWNSQAEKLLGLHYPQDVGQRMHNLIRHPSFIAYANGETEEPDVTIIAPRDDSITLNIRIIPYGHEQSLVMIRDVTMVYQVEQMRRDFVANISHELRTPLTVLIGYIENLQGDALDEQMARALELMGQQTRRMQQLTEDLMLLSSLENSDRTLRRQVVNMVSILASLKEEAEVLSGDRHHVILLEVDERVALRGDPKELDSIFTNLVVNAINYTPESGAIRIRWYADEFGAHFEVHDTGIGIASHHLHRLTERFYRVDVGRSRASGGSGLGLAIVKHAMQQHHGTLRIDSEVGRGSTFICDFPQELVVYNTDNEGGGMKHTG